MKPAYQMHHQTALHQLVPQSIELYDQHLASTGTARPTILRSPKLLQKLFLPVSLQKTLSSGRSEGAELQTMKKMYADLALHSFSYVYVWTI